MRSDVLDVCVQHVVSDGVVALSESYQLFFHGFLAQLGPQLIDVVRLARRILQDLKQGRGGVRRLAEAVFRGEKEALPLHLGQVVVVSEVIPTLCRLLLIDLDRDLVYITMDHHALADELETICKDQSLVLCMHGL